MTLDGVWSDSPGAAERVQDKGRALKPLSPSRRVSWPRPGNKPIICDFVVGDFLTKRKNTPGFRAMAITGSPCRRANPRSKSKGRKTALTMEYSSLIATKQEYGLFPDDHLSNIKVCAYYNT
jgi:hypothetical protein